MRFKLDKEEVDYQLAVHFFNMIMAYGEDTVKEFLNKTLYEEDLEPGEIETDQKATHI